ncbi:MAG TPA: hypothetical protein VFQ30_07900 [Ktedonobacteraceae bacterium]|nr:hypothetical protein [Ktedonobacteraceae bacterium]
MSEKTPEPVQNNQLSRLLSSHTLELLEGKGLDLLQQVGTDVIRQILLDILSGKNLRDSTELLTRSRIASLNIGLTSLFVKGVAQSPDFVRNLPALAADILSQKKLSKTERWLAQWVLGLTGKSVQNVLRDNPTLIERYQQRYVETCNEASINNTGSYGELVGTLKVGEGLAIAHRKEFAVLSALGWRPWQPIRLFILQACWSCLQDAHRLKDGGRDSPQCNDATANKRESDPRGCLARTEQHCGGYQEQRQDHNKHPQQSHNQIRGYTKDQ